MYMSKSNKYLLFSQKLQIDIFIIFNAVSASRAILYSIIIRGQFYLTQEVGQVSNP